MKTLCTFQAKKLGRVNSRAESMQRREGLLQGITPAEVMCRATRVRRERDSIPEDVNWSETRRSLRCDRTALLGSPRAGNRCGLASRHEHHCSLSTPTTHPSRITCSSARSAYSKQSGLFTADQNLLPGRCLLLWVCSEQRQPSAAE